MNGSKRKQLAVPMVALMVCAVAFIGIGYALTAEFTTTNNNTTGGGLSITMGYANESNNSIFVDKKIPYEVHTYNGTDTCYVTGNVEIYSGTVTITNDTGKTFSDYNLSATITGGNVEALTDTYIPAASFTEITINGNTATATMTIAINFGSGKVSIGPNANALTLNSITVTVYAEGIENA